MDETEPFGYLLIDKPAGITSHTVISQLRRITGIKRIGHAGTLDPFATGLLIVAVGRAATKHIDLYMKLAKSYEATFVLGATTPSLDPETERTLDPNFAPQSISEVDLHYAADALTGQIEQIPPAYSAIKIKGKRAYQLARAGKEVEMKTRSVLIEKFDVLDWRVENGLFEVDVRIHCASGTYIRSLARDFAAKLDTLGYVKTLRRTKIGPFSVESAKMVPELAENWKNHLLVDR